MRHAVQATECFARNPWGVPLTI